MISLLKKCLTGASALLVLAMPVPTAAQTQASEPDLKAAIILNMLLFVDWPGDRTLAIDRLTVCYYGNGPVTSALVKLDGRSVKGRTLKVQPIKAANVAECMALYLAPEGMPAERIMSQVGALPILVTSDYPEYFTHGVMLNLELVGGRIVFDIDLRSAQKAGLQVSSKALRLARQVIE